MRNKPLFPTFLVMTALLISSCANTVKAPPENQGSVVFYVEPLYKYMAAPVLHMAIEGEEKLYKLRLGSPFIGMMRIPGELSITEWTGGRKVEMKSFKPVQITIQSGEIALFPFKLRLINKNQIEMMPLTSLDESYIRGILSKEKRYSGLNIIFPPSAEDSSEAAEN